MAERSDAVLRAVESGDPPEVPDLAELRSILSRAVARICPPWLSDRRDDLVQAAVVRILDLQRKSEGNRTFQTSYLYKVAFSALVDEIRRVRRRREVPIDDAGPGAAPSEPAALGEAGHDPERIAMSQEIQSAVRSCLGRLAPERRRAVALHLLGHSVPDAARILGEAVKRTENLVYRGMSDLRRCLEAKGVEP